MAMRFSFILGCALLTRVAAEFEKPQAARLIRQEEKSKHQHVVGASGALKETRRHAGDDKYNLAPKLASQREKVNDECAEEFEYGNKDTKECCPGAEHIDERSMCVNAAEALYMPTGRESHQFDVNQDDYPEGCFKKEGEDVMWYNEYGGQIVNPLNAQSLHPFTLALAVPLCHRPRYKMGTNDTNDGGCTGVWSRVMTEDQCRTFQTCSSHTRIEEWRLGVVAPTPSDDQRPPGAAVYDDFPSGCIISHHDNRVYFNVPQTAADGSVVQPTLLPGSAGGVPICWQAEQGGNTDGTCASAGAASPPAPGPTPAPSR